MTSFAAADGGEMELPHDSNGDLDWNTLGKILTARILGEVLHAKFVDWKYGRVRRDITVDTSWQFAYEKDGIMVLKKTFPDSPLCAFMGRGLIELPLEEVALFIRDISHREQWDEHLMSIEVLRELSSTDFLASMHHRVRRCVIRFERDMVYYERAIHVDDTFVMTVLSVDLPEYPPTPGVTRAQILSGSGWVLEPYDGSSHTTLVSYLAHLDPKALPPIVVNRMAQKQVMAIGCIRDLLTPPSPSPSPSPKSSRRGKKRNKHGRGSTSSLPHIHNLDSSTEHNGDNGAKPSGNGTSDGAAQFEDPVSVYAFIRSNRDMNRMESVPWDMHHHWEGDEHGHTHCKAIEPSPSAERLRSYSEGEPASHHSVPVVQPTLMHQILEDSEDKGRVT